MPTSERSNLLDPRGTERVLARMAREIVERVGDLNSLVLMGIHRRGVPLAAWLAEEIGKAEQTEVPTGTLDITLYRDDLMADRPAAGGG